MDPWLQQKISNFRTFLNDSVSGVNLPDSEKQLIIDRLNRLRYVPDSWILNYFSSLAKEGCTPEEYINIVTPKFRLDLFPPEDVNKLRKYVELFLSLS